MDKLVHKLSSRKFWAAVAGLVTGIGLTLTGNVTEGTTAIVCSVLGYLIAEGYIDAAAVKAATETEETK